MPQVRTSVPGLNKMGGALTIAFATPQIGVWIEEAFSRIYPLLLQRSPEEPALPAPARRGSLSKGTAEIKLLSISRNALPGSVLSRNQPNSLFRTSHYTKPTRLTQIRLRRIGGESSMSPALHLSQKGET